MKTIISLLVCVVAFALIGCGADSDLGASVDASSAPNYEKQIADIQNNTHMPEESKRIAIEQIKSRMAQAGAQDAALKKSK